MPRRALSVCAVTVAAVFSVLDGSMLNVALPHIAAETGMSPSASVWLLNAYQLMIVASLLPMAMVGERIGYARLFRFGVALFTLCALACALSRDAGMLLAARALQGLGSGCVMCCAAALLRASYPTHLFGTGVAINTMAVTFASASGPALSSAILSVAPWHWLFVVSIPAGIVTWCCAAFLPDTPRHARRFDKVSIALNVAALCLSVTGLDMLGRRPAIGVVLLVLAALAWRAWIRRDAHHPTPLLPLDLFRILRFRFAIQTSVLMFAAQMTSLIALPFYFHDIRGLSLMETAALLTAWPITATTATSFSTRLAARFGAARLCMAGSLSMATGLTALLLVPAGASAAWLAPGLLLGGLAVGLFQSPNTHDMLSSTPRSRSGAAGGMQAIARVGGQTLGATLAGIGLGWSASHGPILATLVAIGVALAAFAVNLRRTHQTKCS